MGEWKALGRDIGLEMKAVQAERNKLRGLYFTERSTCRCSDASFAI